MVDGILSKLRREGLDPVLADDLTVAKYLAAFEATPIAAAERTPAGVRIEFGGMGDQAITLTIHDPSRGAIEADLVPGRTVLDASWANMPDRTVA